MAKPKIDKDAVAEAAKKWRRLRIETVLGDGSNPARTVRTTLKHGCNDDSQEAAQWFLREAVRLYLAEVGARVAR